MLKIASARLPEQSTLRWNDTSVLPRQCGAPYYTLDHLSSQALKSVASRVASQSVGDLCRGSLTSSVTTSLRAINPVSWDIHDGQVRLAAGAALFHALCIAAADVNTFRPLCGGHRLLHCDVTGHIPPANVCSFIFIP